MSWTPRSDVVLEGASKYVFENDIDTWDIRVWTPPADLRTGGELSALYVLDPTATFNTTATTVEILTLLGAGAFKPCAVVGIAPVGAFMETHPKRFRDMTPTAVASEAHAAAAVYGLGQADAFLSMLVEEIVPFVEGEHGLSAEGRGIGGWSLGGLFACHALLSRTSDFDRYLAVSPSLWWDSELLVQQAKELPAGVLAGKHLYIGTGELENDIERMWPPIPAELYELAKAQTADADMCGSALRFAEALALHSGARLRQEIIPLEHHASVWGAAMTRGLVELY